MIIAAFVRLQESDHWVKQTHCVMFSLALSYPPSGLQHWPLCSLWRNLREAQQRNAAVMLSFPSVASGPSLPTILADPFSTFPPSLNNVRKQSVDYDEPQTELTSAISLTAAMFSVFRNVSRTFWSWKAEAVIVWLLCAGRRCRIDIVQVS